MSQNQSQLNDGFPVQLLEMLRTLDAKMSEVNERTIRIEAQEFGKKFTELEGKFEDERKERVALQLSLERIQTKIAPLLLLISTVGSSGLTVFVSQLIRS